MLSYGRQTGARRRPIELFAAPAAAAETPFRAATEATKRRGSSVRATSLAAARVRNAEIAPPKSAPLSASGTLLTRRRRRHLPRRIAHAINR